VASPADIPGTQFYPAGATVDRDYNYGALHVTTGGHGRRPPIGINQWIDAIQKIVWVDTLPTSGNGRTLKPDYVKAGYSVLLKTGNTASMDPITTPGAPPKVTTVQDVANYLFNVQKDLSTTLSGIDQAANAAANKADATQAAVIQGQNKPTTNNNTILLIGGGILALFLLKKL
jgi:hypothetical protein